MDVVQYTGLGVASQAGCRDGFGDFLQRAGPAGQGDEGIPHLEHGILALAHRVYRNELGQARVDFFGCLEKLRDDADSLAAVG